MKRTQKVTVIFFFLFITFRLDERPDGFRGLASAWNIIPSRSLSGLHYIFKGYTHNEKEGSVKVTGPVIEITLDEKDSSKVYPDGFTLEMDEEDFEEEQFIGQSIFQARSGSGRTVGTAFLVGQDLVLTNRHVLGVIPKKRNWSCGVFSILLNHKEERVECEKVRFCSSQFDYCVVQMKKMLNGLSLGTEIRPLRLARTIRSGPNVQLLHIGNAAGLGLQASRGIGLRLSGGEFHHYVPTLIGSSGAPLINEQGQVVGINWGHTGKDFVDDTSFNRGVLSSTIFSELKRTHPYTLNEIKSFKSWSAREKKHRKVSVESRRNVR